MTSHTKSGINRKKLSQKQDIDWLGLIQKVWTSKKLIFKVCCIGVIAGIVICFSIPKEYIANSIIAPESTRRTSSSNMDAMAEIAGVNSSITTTGKDAIYPSLYPKIIKSTPFLIGLFDVKVREQNDTTVITLSRYLKERQKFPWWSVIKSAPSRLLGLTISLLKGMPEVDKRKSKVDSNSEINLLQLTREEAGIAAAIASRIHVGVDKEKRTITLFATMQDPLVAATVADTVSAHLKEYITSYRTSKARRLLKYNEALCKEAQAEYYAAQEKYTQYADANQNLVMLTSRAELSRLRSEMELALSIYNQMEKQVQAAQAKVEKVTPVYAVIQPVVVPLAPSKPRKVLIITLCILLSATGSIGWILFMKDFIEKIKKRIILPVGK